MGSRHDGSLEPDLASQIRLAFRNLFTVLEAAGCTLVGIADVTTFHTDPATQFETVIAVKGEVFSDAPYPNWTTVSVIWLAGFDFEIRVIARVPVQGWTLINYGRRDQ